MWRFFSSRRTGKHNSRLEKIERERGKGGKNKKNKEEIGLLLEERLEKYVDIKFRGVGVWRGKKL